MRKFWIGMALTGLIVASAAAGAWAAGGTRKNIEVEYRNIKISVDGKTVDAGETEPFIYVAQGRTYVPARPLAEALGAKVGWDEASSTVQVYTANYVKATTDGEYKVWSMPAQGFAIRAPRGFVQMELGAATLQLALPNPATGNNSIVAVTQSDAPSDGSTLAQRMDAIIAGLTQTFLPGAKVTSAAETGNQRTVEGTTSLFGQGSAAFTLRLVATAKGDWLILTLAPGEIQSQMAPVMKEIMGSFTLTE